MSRYLYPVSIALFFGGQWLTRQDETSFDGPVLLALAGVIALGAFLWDRRRQATADDALDAGGGATAGSQAEREGPGEATAASLLRNMTIIWAVLAGFDLVVAFMPVQFVSFVYPALVGHATTGTFQTVISAAIVAICAGVIALLWFGIGKPLRNGGTNLSTADGKLRTTRTLMVAWGGATIVFQFGAFMVAAYQGTTYPGWVALCGALLMFLARPWQARLATLLQAVEASSAESTVAEARVQPAGQGAPGSSPKDGVSLKRVALVLVLLLVGLVGGLGTLMVLDRGDDGGEESMSSGNADKSLAGVGWTTETEAEISAVLHARAKKSEDPALSEDITACAMGLLVQHPFAERNERLEKATDACSALVVLGIAARDISECRELMAPMVGSVYGGPLLASHHVCACMASEYKLTLALDERKAIHRKCLKLGLEPAAAVVVTKPWPKKSVAKLKAACLDSYTMDTKEGTRYLNAYCRCLETDAPDVFEASQFEGDPSSVLDDDALGIHCNQQVLPERMGADGGHPACLETFSKLGTKQGESYCSCLLSLVSEPVSPERRQKLRMCLMTAHDSSKGQ